MCSKQYLMQLSVCFNLAKWLLCYVSSCKTVWLFCGQDAFPQCNLDSTWINMKDQSPKWISYRFMLHGAVHFYCILPVVYCVTIAYRIGRVVLCGFFGGERRRTWHGSVL